MASPYARASLAEEIMVSMPDGSVRRQTLRPDRPRPPVTVCGPVRNGRDEEASSTWCELDGPTPPDGVGKKLGWETFGLVIAVGWMLDRLRTTANDAGDATATAIMHARGGLSNPGGVTLDETFGLITAVDWMPDRLQATTNVMTDASRADSACEEQTLLVCPSVASNGSTACNSPFEQLLCKQGA